MAIAFVLILIGSSVLVVFQVGNLQARAQSTNPGGYVKYTLLTYNNTLKNGNVIPSNAQSQASFILGGTGAAFNPTNGQLYVSGGFNTTAIDGSSNTAVGDLNLQAGDMIYDSANGYLYGTAPPGIQTQCHCMYVQVFDLTKNKAIANVSLGREPQGYSLDYMVYDSSNGDIYVLSSQGTQQGIVYVLDPTLNKVVTQVTVGCDPTGIAFDSVNSNLYVSNAGGCGAQSNSVTIINGATNAITGTIALFGQCYSATNIVFDAVNHNLYLALVNQYSSNCSGGPSVLVDINPTTDSAVANVTIGVSNEGFVYGPDLIYDSSSGNVYIAEDVAGSSYPVPSSTGLVLLLDGRTNSIVSTVTLGVINGPYGGTYDPLNGDLYLVNAYSVSVLDTKSNSLVSTLGTGLRPEEISYDSANGNLYVLSYGPILPQGSGAVGSVSVLSGTTDSVVTTSNLGGGLTHEVFDTANGYLYVMDSLNNAVYYMSTATGLVDGYLNPSYPMILYGLTYDNATRTLYVADQNNSPNGIHEFELTLVNSANDLVLALSLRATASGGGSVGPGMASNPSNGDVYIGSYNNAYAWPVVNVIDGHATLSSAAGDA